MRIRSLIALLGCAGILAGCSGGGHGATASLPSSPTSKATGTAVFVVNVPTQQNTTTRTTTHTATSGARGGVKPQYLSPATQSITVNISGPTDYSATANLTVNSSGCTSTLSSTICTLSVPGLLPCTTPATNCYTATLTTYDQTGGTGNELSGAQAVAFTITAGQANTIDISLSGIPASTLVLPVGVFTQSNGSGGYDLIGLGAHKFIVETLDADGNIIAGPGAPTFALGSTSGSLAVTIAAPTTNSPNEFSVTPPPAYSASAASFTVSPTFADQQTNGCALTGANCSGASVSVDMKQMLVVSNAPTVPGEINLYVLGATSPFASLTSSVEDPTHLAADASGDIFVANWNGVSASNVLEFAAGGTSLTNAIAVSGYPVALGTEALHGNLGIAVCSSGDSYNGGSTSGCGGTASDAFEIVAPPYNGTPTTITTNINWPMAVSGDANGNLYVTSCNSCTTPPGADTVLEYNGSGTLEDTYTLGDACPCPSLYVDSSGNVFVSETAVTDVIAEYAQAGTISSELITSDVGSAPIALAGSGGNLFLANYSGTGGNVVVYDSEGTTASEEITNGVSGAVGLAFDAAGDLYVPNVGLSEGVKEYAGAGTALSQTITTGATNPQSIIIIP